MLPPEGVKEFGWTKDASVLSDARSQQGVNAGEMFGVAMEYDASPGPRFDEGGTGAASKLKFPGAIATAYASRKVLAKAGLSLAQMGVFELNEAFASQALAVLRDLGIPDDTAHA